MLGLLSFTCVLLNSKFGGIYLYTSLCKFTLIERSPEADTMYLSSKSTTLTAALWPTSTLLRLISVGDLMSHTAMERSLEHVTISPFANRK